MQNLFGKRMCLHFFRFGYLSSYVIIDYLILVDDPFLGNLVFLESKHYHR